MSVRLLNLDQIRNGLKDKRLYQVSKIVGLSYPTLRNLISDPKANPSYSTLVVLSDYIINTSTLRR
jgi:hypothetical protein